MTDQVTPLATFEPAEFVPPEPVPAPDPNEPPRPTDYLLLLPLLVIGLGLAFGWFWKWKDTVPPLAKDWSPACAEEAPAWQLFHPPTELQYHSEPGEWILGHAEVAVRWHGPPSFGPSAPPAASYGQDALTTSTGEPPFLTTLVGNAPYVTQQYANANTQPLDAGLTSNTVWFLGEVGTSGAVLELAARSSGGSILGSQVVTPLKLPATLPDASGKQVPVTWLARDYGDDKLLLIGLERRHASPEFAELQVISLPSGKVDSTVRVPLQPRQRFSARSMKRPERYCSRARRRLWSARAFMSHQASIEPLSEVPAEFVVAEHPLYGNGNWLLSGSAKTQASHQHPPLAMMSRTGRVPESPSNTTFSRPHGRHPAVPGASRLGLCDVRPQFTGASPGDVPQAKSGPPDIQ